MLVSATNVWGKGFRSLLGRWRALSVDVRDGTLALVLTVSAFVPTLSAIGAQIGDLPVRSADALGVALTLAQSVPLAVRTRFPAVCLGMAGGAFALHNVLAFPTTFASVGLYFALYAAGAYQDRFRRRLAVAASAVYVVFAVVLHDLGSPQRVQDFAAFYLALVLAWLAGGWMRRWRAEEVERRRLASEAATAVERARIARELHDVVTHHVTAMVVQADAAQFQLRGSPDRVEEGLTAISGTGRRALTELRHLLGVLQATGESADGPAFGRLHDLVEQTRQAGQPVELVEQGEQPSMAVGPALTAYRVVQESLTNALKHAPGRRTTVQVRYGDEWVRIEVTTDGPPVAPSPGGHGLAGLRARVGLIGGELSADPRPGGGFAVEARIPVRTDR